MSKIDINFAELHNALFLGGKNHGLKLDPARSSGLALIYDRDEKELLVSWNNEKAIIPSSNIASMTEGKVKDRKVIQQITHPMVASVGSAQVETPMSHVHGGPGKGRVR
jgi:hypothetical protein